MAKKSTSAMQKLQHKTYQDSGSYAKNKKAGLIRHLKTHENDAQAQKALKSVDGAKSSRFGKKFKKSIRSHLDKITAPIFARKRALERISQISLELTPPIATDKK